MNWCVKGENSSLICLTTVCYVDFSLTRLAGLDSAHTCTSLGDQSSFYPCLISVNNQCNEALVQKKEH